MKSTLPSGNQCIAGQNTDLAQKLAIDFSDDLVSARLLLPLDEDFPVLGGKNVASETPVLAWLIATISLPSFSRVSGLGVPVPNAWLG
ncbi:MAG: hypothetical protein P0107_04560 [Nitrosomonas sp.]|nr:hypothetical protein [Nitrosomonas sp.]